MFYHPTWQVGGHILANQPREFSLRSLNSCQVLVGDKRKFIQLSPRDLSVLHDGQWRLPRSEGLSVEPEEPPGGGHLRECPRAAVEADGRLSLHQRRLEGEPLAAQQPQQVSVVSLRACKQEGS